MISLTRVRELFDYCPFTGDLIYRINKGRYQKGRVAGTLLSNGYLRIFIDKKSNYVHRLAFLHFHGECPDEIDHANGIKTDNRIVNLRACGRSGNLGNTTLRKVNTSGFKGVFKYRRRWVAKIAQKHLGVFDTPVLAAMAYDDAAAAHYGEFVLTNKQMGLY